MTEKEFHEVWAELEVGEKMSIIRDAISYRYLDGDAEVFDMEDFDEVLEFLTPYDIARKVCYGKFNPYDEYFYLDVYENLYSLSKYEVDDYLDTYEDSIYHFLSEKDKWGDFPFLKEIQEEISAD